jgi:hypothetical protein
VFTFLGASGGDKSDEPSESYMEDHTEDDDAEATELGEYTGEQIHNPSNKNLERAMFIGEPCTYTRSADSPNAAFCNLALSFSDLCTH